MTVYHFSTRIHSNLPVNSLLYDLCIYRMDSDRNKYTLIDVKQQSLLGNYETQRHMTRNINDLLSTIYIMEIKLYRKTMLHTHCVTPIPFTKMYTLEEFSSGKAWSPVKRENPGYFESKGTMKPESQGGETKKIKITIPERPFIAKDYPVGNSMDPFEKTRIEQQINKRYNLYPDYFPDQNAASVCGPAAFFIVFKWIAQIYMRRSSRNYGYMGKPK